MKQNQEEIKDIKDRIELQLNRQSEIKKKFEEEIDPSMKRCLQDSIDSYKHNIRQLEDWKNMIIDNLECSNNKS